MLYSYVTGEVIGKEQKMKKRYLILILIFFNIYTYAQEFIFPPELKWWLEEIQKIDTQVGVKKFKLSEERFILEEDGVLSYKNKLYPVLKKWNYYGNQFAYNNISCSLIKKKNDKYSIASEPDSQFGIFDRNENLLFIDFFGSSEWLDSFCWVRDNRILAVGRKVIDSAEKNLYNVDFIIYDYFIKAGKIIVKEYTYNLQNINLINLNLSWFEQRRDYFETE